MENIAIWIQYGRITAGETKDCIIYVSDKEIKMGKTLGNIFLPFETLHMIVHIHLREQLGSDLVSCSKDIDIVPVAQLSALGA